MNQPPYISVITCALNSGPTIRETIESIRSQNFNDFEHVVCDGGSQDKTVDILKEYSGSYNLKWTSEQDLGIADALNKGLRNASGKFIVVIQADDVFLASDSLLYVYSFLQHEEYDLYSFPVLFDKPGQSFKLRKPIRHLWYNRFKFIFPHQGCFVRRGLFDEIGGFNKSFKIAMDYDFFYRALKYNCSVQFGEKPVALMGGAGIGSISETVPHRLWEERMVQAINEDNKVWRTAQKIFWRLYMPYKKKQLRKSY